MTAIFTVLGFGLLGGGLFGIYSGWPYMVLERGFTQVIIGTVAATGGLILLSLAWVLRELKAMRRDWAESSDRRHAELDLQAAPAPVLPPAEPQRQSLAPALGLGAAGVAAGAVAAALARDDGTEAKSDKPERDLFGSLVAQRLADEPAPEETADDREASETEEAKPVADLFAAEREAETERETPAAQVDGQSNEPVEIVAAMVQPLSQDEALAKTDLAEAEPVETGFVERAAWPPVEERREPIFGDAFPLADERREPAISEPEPDVAGEPAPTLDPFSSPSASEAKPAEPEIDEFSALRESLTSQLGISRPQDRPETAPEPMKDPFALADDGRPAIDSRREPFFERPDPSEPEAEPTEEPIAAWPPKTGSTFFEQRFEQGETQLPRPEDQPASVPEPELTSEAVAASAEVEPADEVGPQEPEPEQPPSSDEGVVGAYQVGDAHFTIFADGSIRARTPDGEYSFASMDELKVYLASEKSRLGV